MLDCAKQSLKPGYNNTHTILSAYLPSEINFSSFIAYINIFLFAPETVLLISRFELCFVLQKLSKICSNQFRRKTFEMVHTDITCQEILNFNNTIKICDENDMTNPDLIHQNSRLADFLFDYASENLAVLNIFIKDPYFTLIKKDEKMSSLSLIASAGGLLGLCMGLSFVSVFEVFYHGFQCVAFPVSHKTVNTIG
jgi:hypothetical protein